MEQTTSLPDQDRGFMVELRRRRAELREAMSALEHALAAPAADDRARWGERVHVALVELSADLRDHVEITEGPDGLYSDLRRRAPRLAGPVEALIHEHEQIKEQVDDLAARVTAPEGIRAVTQVRERGTALLGILVRHRQRGSDLVYEAYDVDIGGET